MIRLQVGMGRSAVDHLLNLGGRHAGSLQRSNQHRPIADIEATLEKCRSEFVKYVSGPGCVHPLHGLEHKVRGRRRCRPVALPDLRVELDVIKLRNGLANVIPESCIATTLAPAHANLVCGIAEDRTETVVDRYLIAELLGDLVDTHSCTVLLSQPSSPGCFVVASKGHPEADMLRIDLADYPEVCHALQTRQPVVIDDIEQLITD